MTTIDQLLEVQELDVRIAEHERELQDIPARKAHIETRLLQHRESVKDARDAVRLRQAEVKQVEGEIEAKREKVLRLRDQQMQLKTNKEFRAMESEVAQVVADIDGLESRVLELLETVDAGGIVLRERESELTKEESAVGADTARMDERAADIRARADDLLRKRQDMARAVDPEWLAAYERIMRNRKDRALVSAENGVCGGCHMTLPPYLRHEAKKRAGIVTCEFCGRMLYH